MIRAAIIGGGSWGLATANLLQRNGAEVYVWEYNEEYASEVKETGYNQTFLPGVLIDKSIIISSDLGEILSIDPSLLVFALPSHTMRPVVRLVSKYILEESRIKAVVNLSKGIEEETMLRMSQVLASELPDCLTDKISTLSGPSHAEEVARFIPTTVTLAGKNDESLAYVQELFSNEYFRVYTSNDIVGVEMGGAIKNVISIAAGIIDGLGLGDNTMGALLTRGLAEIRRLGVKLGSDQRTFNGLSGIGDLVTTAISKHSRNRYVGFQLGKGKKLDDILASMKMVAEGVRTTKSIYRLAVDLQVSMPITTEVYHILFNNKDPQKAIRDLMTRELKEED